MCRLTAAGVPPAEAARAAREHFARRAAAKPLADGSPAAVDHPADTSQAWAEPSADTFQAGSEPPADSSPSRAEPSADISPATPRPAPEGGEPPSAPVAPRPARGAHSGSGLPLGDVRREGRGLARAAVRMDSVAVQEQITAAIATYGLIDAWETVLTPTLRAVGRKWESSDDRYVEVEHLLSWHISATLRHGYVGSVLRHRAVDARPVLLACLPGEQHTLPLEALGAALAEHGLPVLMLGAAVPAEALLAAVRRTGPGTVALWSQSRSTADWPLARHVAATWWGVRGARTRSRVLLSGPGWGVRTAAGLLRPRGLREAVALSLPSAGAPETSDPQA
ncbi:cobalamin-dependent protein [Streptomyces chromofuscus]|uniref:Cobalamin-dependent protein n=2 Tax=Streptomyces chromofuscus TaxID=42881 RepID=A0A7M2TGD8_STRCW|nr:cobalamin-dependent protein [Streptomyces chromofuscus]